MRSEAVSRLEASLGFAGEPGLNRVLAVRALPGSLAGQTAGRVRQGLQAFLVDLPATVLAEAVRALSLPVASVLGLLALLVENLPDGVAVRHLALNLREVGSPKSPAH